MTLYIKRVQQLLLKKWKFSLWVLFGFLCIIFIFNASISQSLTLKEIKKRASRDMSLYQIEGQEGESNKELYGTFPQMVSSLTVSKIFSKPSYRFAKRISSERKNNEFYFLGVAGNSFLRVYFGNRLVNSELEFIEQFDAPSRITSIAFYPNDSFVAYGDEEGNITAWEIRGYKTRYKRGRKTKPKLGSLSRTKQSHNGPVNSLSFSPGGRFLVSGGSDYLVRIWDIFAYQTKTLYSHKNIVTKVLVSPDGKYIASCGYDREVILYDRKKRKKTILKSSDPKNTLKHNHWVSDLAFSLDGKNLVSVGYDRQILLWDISDLNNVKVELIGKHNTAIHAVAYSTDGTTIASAGSDGTIILWKGGQKVKTTKNHKGVVENIVFSPKGDVLFSGSNYGKIILQNTK